MSKTTANSTTGTSGAFLLFLLFLGLKLTGYITWSWLWVTAPLWIPTALALTMALVVGGIAGIIALFSSRKPKRYGIR